MKKRKFFKILIATALITLISVSMIGCGGDKVNKDGTQQTGQRLINTGDMFDPGRDYSNMHVFYDAKTKIVYLISQGAGGSMCPMIGQNKLPMTLDEYNAMK